MLNKISLRLVVIALLLLVLAGCGSPADAALRAGDWEVTSDMGKIIFTINADGTQVTKVVASYKCGSKGVTINETVTLNKDNGWPIKNGKIVVDDLKKSQNKMTINGKFNAKNTEITGKWSAMSCSAGFDKTVKTSNTAP